MHNPWSALQDYMVLVEILAQMCRLWFQDLFQGIDVCNAYIWDPFHKAFFQSQMTKISDKSVDNQSQASISVAYNKNCYLSLMTSFVSMHHKCVFFLP